jgi:hypothetical protein
MNFVARIFTSATVAILLLLNSGCAVVVLGGAVAAGAGAVAWMNGELRSTESLALDQVIPATKAGLKDMGYGAPTQQNEDGNVKFVTYAANGKKVQVTLVKLSPTSTDIRIRVSTFGDEQLSRQILTKIQSHLVH